MFKVFLIAGLLAAGGFKSCNVEKRVVNVVTTMRGVVQYPDGEIRRMVGICTASLVSSDGLVLTARHCIEGRLDNDSVYVVVDGVRIKARIIADSVQGYDFAILDIPGNSHWSLTPCKQVNVGDEIYVVGMPSQMIEAAYGEVLENNDGDLYTSAYTRNGFSGGPVVKKRGKCLAGVHWGRVKRGGKWFSAEVSIDKIKKIIGRLKSK